MNSLSKDAVAVRNVRVTMTLTNDEFELALTKRRLTLGDFCAENKLPIGEVTMLMKFQVSPLGSDGRYTKLCRDIARLLHVLPENLFSRELYEKALEETWPEAIVFAVDSRRLKRLAVRSIRQEKPSDTPVLEAEDWEEKHQQFALIMEALPALPCKCQEVLCTHVRSLKAGRLMLGEYAPGEKRIEFSLRKQELAQAFELLRAEVRALELRKALAKKRCRC